MQTLTISTLPLIDVPATLVLGFTTTTTLATIQAHNDVPEQLYNQATRLGLTVSGSIQYVYEGATDDAMKEFGLIIALPIREAEPGTLTEGFAFQTLPPFRATSYTYEGAWNTFMELYDALFPAFTEQGYAYSGQIREVYTVVDFEQPNRCITEILIGVN
jgi:predicted transcriptional regulator YdeE